MRFVNTSVPPVLDECDHLRVGFTQNALPVHLHQPVPWSTHIQKKGQICVA